MLFLRYPNNNFGPHTFPTEIAPRLGSSRDHLRIEADGHLLNTMDPPSVPLKSGATPPPTSVPMVQLQQVPTPQQSQRMKRYSEDIAKRNAQLERKERTNEFLRQSIRCCLQFALALRQSHSCHRQNHHFLNHTCFEKYTGWSVWSDSGFWK